MPDECHQVHSCCENSKENQTFQVVQRRAEYSDKAELIRVPIDDEQMDHVHQQRFHPEYRQDRPRRYLMSLLPPPEHAHEKNNDPQPDKEKLRTKTPATT